MSRRFIPLSILVLVLALPTVAESADCGCGTQPCTQETLTTVPLPNTVRETMSEEMEFTIASCWDCGGTMNLPSAFLVASVLFMAMAGVKRVVCGPDHLILLRLGDCNAT
jgi:hypothetical protein